MFSSQRISITHVKQTHLPNCRTNITPSEMEEIAYSQFNVCRAIISNPDALVVQESLYENYTPDLMSKNQNTVRAKELFPNGIPPNYAELSEEQKNYLARRSGAVTLFDLGILSHIYKSIGKDESQQINILTAQGYFEVIYTPRELLAIKYAIQAARSISNQDVQVLVIFGGIHDFNLSISSYNEDGVFYAGCIETSLLDQNVMRSSDIVASLYQSFGQQLSRNSKSLLPNLSVFHTLPKIDISKLPSSKGELSSPLSSENMKEGIQALSFKYSRIQMRRLNF